MPKYNLDNNVKAELIGENQDQQEAQAFLTKAFSVALFMMLMILLLQFNSFYSGLLILFAVVMSTAGVLIGLMITGQAFGIVMTGVGVIALAGIVVNNNIILIDTFDYLKNKTDNVKEAIVKTGAQRLRPVLLTTTTTVLGLLTYGNNDKYRFCNKRNNKRFSRYTMVGSIIYSNCFWFNICNNSYTNCYTISINVKRKCCKLV